MQLQAKRKLHGRQWQVPSTHSIAQPSLVPQTDFTARAINAHRRAFIPILLYLELAVAVAAQYDCVVLLHCHVLATCRALLPLQVLPALGARKGFEDDGDIILSCNGGCRCFELRNT
jgi:hypothetical protein